MPKEQRSGSQLPVTLGPLGYSSTTHVAAILKEAFSSLAVEMNKRFSSLGALLKAKKKRKTDDCIVLSKDNSGILNKFKKELHFSKQDGAEIHGHLATIVQKFLKDKPKEDKLNEIKKRYLRPNNCEMLAETRLT